MLNTMMSKHRILLAVALVVIAAPAFTQVEDGLYVSGAYLLSFAAPQEFSVGAKPDQDADFEATRTGHGSFDVGLVGLRLAGGYRIFGFRPEVEFSYRELPLTSLEYESLSLPNGVKVTGAALEALNDTVSVQPPSDIRLLGLMANVWYDLDTGSPVVPFIGFGIGASQVTIRTKIKIELPPLSTERVFPPSSGWAFAYQAGGGVGFDLGFGLTARIGYRVYGTTDAEMEWNAEASATEDVLRAGSLHHNIGLGLQFRF